MRARLGLPTAGPLVVSVSRLVPRKGMDVLIEAAARLAPSYPDLVVAVAGAGRELETLRRQAARSPVTVAVLGRVSDEDRAGLLAAGDVFVMACRNRWFGLEQEGFGIVFLEAAAAGVPQIAGDSGGRPRSRARRGDRAGRAPARGPGGAGRGPAHPAGRSGAAPAHGAGGPGPGGDTFAPDALASRLADALTGVAI